MKHLLLFLALTFPAALSAQCTISVTNPTSATNITGASVYQFLVTVSVASPSACPAQEHVKYFVDGQDVGRVVRSGGFGGPCPAGSPYCYQWNPNLSGNGSKQIYAVLYSATNAVLATSATVTFTSGMTFPQALLTSSTTSYTITWGVTTSQPDGSNWTGQVNFTGAATGTQPTLGLLLYVDSQTVSSGASPVLDTTVWPNGPHNVCYVAQDSQNNVYGQWCRTETFANTGTTIGFIGQGPSVPSPGGVVCKGTNGVSTSFTCQSGNAIISPGLPFFVSFASQVSSIDISTISGCSVTPTEVATSNTHTRSSVWECTSAAETTNTITIGLTGACSGWCNINLLNVEGVGTTTDGSALNPGTGSTTMSTGSITTTNAADLVIAVAAGNAGCTTGQSSLPNGFTALNVSDGGCDRTQMAYKIQSAAGAESTSFTSGTSQSYDTVIVAFKQATTPAPVNFLVSSARTETLCASASTLCPTSATLTGKYFRADGTTTSATLTGCASGNTGSVTISGTCTENAVAGGTAEITLTAAAGLTRASWTSVQSTNVVPHFSCTTGQVLTTYTAGQSCFLHSLFFSNSPTIIQSNLAPVATPYVGLLKQAGWNALEPSWNVTTNGAGAVYNSAASFQNVSQTNFQNYINTLESNWCTFSTTNGLYQHVSGNSWYPAVFNASGTFYTTRGTVADNGTGSGLYSPAGNTFLASAWGSCNRTVGSWLTDEVQADFGPVPQQSQPIMGGTVTQIMASGGSCTATFSAGFAFENNTDNFIITGATTSGFNSATGTLYTYSGLTGSMFHFSCPSVANGTYNHLTDPNLLFEVAVQQWYFIAAVHAGGSGYQTGSGLATTGGSGSGLIANIVTSGGVITSAVVSNSGSLTGYVTGDVVTVVQSGGSGGQLTLTADYPRWNFAQQIMTDYKAATNPPCQTWPVSSQVNSSPTTINWMYDSRMACHAGWYPSGVFQYLRGRLPPQQSIGDQGDRVRGLSGAGGTANVTIPATLKTETIMADYGYQGDPISATSCVDNTVTLAANVKSPTVYPLITRINVAGSSSANCDGFYWVWNYPTLSTVNVVNLFGSAVSGVGTLTFDDGHVFNSTTVRAVSTTNWGSNGQTISNSSTMSCERGNRFKITGTGTALDNTYGVFMYANPSQSGNCSSDSTGTFGVWLSVPSITASTGGTATLFYDNYFVPGRNSYFLFHDPAWSYQRTMYAPILNMTGQRGYVVLDTGDDPNYTQTAFGSLNGFMSTVGLNSSTNWGSGPATLALNLGNLSEQSGGFPFSSDPNALDNFWMYANGNPLITRFVPQMYQPTLPAPDIEGLLFECVAHQGSLGNMLYCQNMTDAPQTVTIPMAAGGGTSLLISGQPFLQYLNDYRGTTVTQISAGTTSVSATVPREGVVAYVFPTTLSGWLNQPPIAPRLADISGATSIAVRWGYAPYWVDQTSVAYACGSIPCSPPWDRGIGTIYYRIIYLGSGNQVLATSDIQTL